ncbi:hypothetical protein [Pedobacter zeae]|uniref:Uncharacterized protein n=1 Tax=Pedobacter zeae TaxID=1737356 RepID=A0A7W6KB28_9SPHI|nr:hypothetical protein [Pedobacter zeae]MBB4108510.1 hypothetical protein [Pedobacter zeae]GGG92327.1 hypothetical protein GCM10007422_01700 [Pedobacter zeae]
MNQVHLNEEQLQDYAITGITDPSVVQHLTGCARCQVQVKAYQTLYSYIREAKTPILDFKAEELIPDRLPAINKEDSKEAWYLYGFLFGAIGLLTAGAVVFWGSIRWIFTGIVPWAIIIGFVLFSGLLMVQLMELYNTYRKKLRALNME